VPPQDRACGARGRGEGPAARGQRKVRWPDGQHLLLKNLKKRKN